MSGVGGHHVFKVHAHGACLDDLSDGSFKGCNVGGEARLNIGSDGHFDGAADAGDSLKHLRPGKVLSVWEAKGVGHGGAAGGDGWQPQCSTMAALAASQALMRTSGCEA